MLGINLKLDTSSSSVSNNDTGAPTPEAVVAAADIFIALLYFFKSSPSILNMYTFSSGAKKSNFRDLPSLNSTQ
mgnify:CR=1 FL=1